MKYSNKVLLCCIVVLFIIGSGCNLTSLLSGTGGDEVNSSEDEGSTAGSAVDTTQFTAETNPGLVRTDKKKFQEGDFAARSLPIEVTFSSNVTPVVTFQGALAEPDYTVENATTEILRIFIVMEVIAPSILEQDESGIHILTRDMVWKVDLLDSDSNLLLTTELKNNYSVAPNIPLAYEVYLPQIPKNTSRVVINAGLDDGIEMGYDCVEQVPDRFCATAADLNFVVPKPIVYTTPVKITLSLSNFNENYKKDSLVGNVLLQIKNPFNMVLTPTITFLFLDDSGALVGYAMRDYYLEPKGIYDFSIFAGSGYQTSYLSAIPTQVLIYHWLPMYQLLNTSRYPAGN